jgi:hypothetical protein
MFRSYWNTLNNQQLATTRIMSVQHASGIFTNVESTSAELRILRHDQANNMLVPMTPWFVENFVIRDDSPNVSLLSGREMRNWLYFATAPGNQELFVSVKKNGIMSKLPVI